MCFVDELHTSANPARVYDALIAAASRVAGVFTAVVYGSDDAAENIALRPYQDLRVAVPLEPLPVRALSRFVTPCVVTDVDAGGDTPGDVMLAPVLAAFGAAQLFCCRLGAGAMLVLVDRRRDRVFTGEDRDAIQWLIRQAERVLARLQCGNDLSS